MYEKRLHGFVVAMGFVGMTILAGCIHNTYDVVMHPEGETLERELTCYRGHEQDGEQKLTEFPGQELERFNAVYDSHSTSDQGKKHVFQGSFTARTPDDVGGSGWYLHWKTDLGSVSGYVERFRGNDDVTERLTERQRGVDQTVDYVIGWMESELGKEPGFASLREFLDGRFRRDMQNVSLYLFELDGRDEPNQEHQNTMTTVRILQMLMDRGYFAPEELPELSRAFEDLQSRNKPQRVLKRVQRFVATKMGTPSNRRPPESLAFLGDEKRAEQSLKKYLKKTTAYQKAVEKWEEEKRSNPEAGAPDPGAVLGEAVQQGFLGDLFSGGDQVNVSLMTRRMPYRTNGKWDADKIQVTWSRTIDPRGEERQSSPRMLYAFWGDPNRDVQQRRFGRVLLEDQALEEYVRWYHGLTSAEKTQWDRFLGQLTPDKAAERLKEFRFEGEPAGPQREDGQRSLLSDTARSLIRLDE